MDKPFAAVGPTFTVSTAAVQLPGSVGSGGSFRVRCLATGYLAWGTSNAVTVTAPVAGTPQLNVLGMTIGAVEKISGIPIGGWLISSVASGFEVTQGDGI